MRYAAIGWLFLATSVVYADQPGFVRSWPTVSAGPSSLAIDLAGTLWVVVEADQALERYSLDGSPIQRLGTPFPNRMVGWSPAAGLILSHPNAGVVSTTALSPIAGLGQFSFVLPLGVAASGIGQIFVGEPGLNTVYRFSPQGQYLGQWTVQAPGDLAGGAQTVYVIATETCEVIGYGIFGEVLHRWGQCGSANGLIGLANPAAQTPGLATDAQGNVYVADVANSRIQVFGPAGQWLYAWGSQGSGPGQFDQPRDVVVSISGEVYVADYGNNRIQQFAPPVAVLPTSWAQVKVRYR